MPNDGGLTEQERGAVLRIVGAADEAPPRLTRVEQIRVDDPRVLRVGHDDRTWVVKRASVPAGDERLYSPWGFYAEWVGSATVSDSDSDIGPAFLGGDADAPLLVFQDLGANQDLSHVLRGGDRELAVTSLEAMADALGRLHAATGTAEARTRYLGRWRELCGDREPPTLRLPAPRLADAVRASLDAASVTTPVVTVDDLEDLQTWATQPPLGAVLIHGDPCLDNWVLDDNRVPKLIDFQGAVFGPASLDAAYARAPLPTCWCVRRIPLDVVERFEERHRAAIARAQPALADVGTYRADLTFALGWWFIGQVTWRLERATTESDGERQRHLGFDLISNRDAVLLRLDAFVRLSSETGQLAQLAAWAVALRQALVDQWREPEVDVFPAFGGPPA